jgi:glycosyltransferase involved in cell wall biosynthesis
MTERLTIVGPASRPTGGVARYVDEQERILSKVFHVEVHDYSFPRKSHEIGSFPVSGIKKSLEQFFKIFFRDEPDMLHVHCASGISFYRSSAYVIYSDLLWDCGIILHIHGSDFDDFIEHANPLRKRYIKYVFNSTDRLVVLSKKWKDVVSGLCPLENIVILPNAVNAEKYSPKYEEFNEINVVFISHMIERKGVVELVEAIRDLDHKTLERLKIYLAGDGPLKQKVMKLSSNIENVEYLGYVSEEKKIELLNGGSIYMLPSHAEGLPFAILEAMAGGNAIVSTRVGSIPEIIGPDQGILIPPKNSCELTTAIEELVASPERLQNMKRANSEEVRESYSWDSVREDLISMYSDIEQETS